MACCLFKRPHHQRIVQLLRVMDADLLSRAKCYFGGGTAITLQLDEYRESVDVDFLCSDRDGYRLLRNAITPPTLGAVLLEPVKHVRDARTRHDKISTFLEVDGAPIRVEFVLEARIPIDGALDPTLRVPLLARTDLNAEKLLANADRGLDCSQMSRDLVDLAMMIESGDRSRRRHGTRPRALMAGLSVMLAGEPRQDRRALLDLAESLNPGASEPAVLARWLQRSPLRPSRFLPLLAMERQRVA